MIAKLDAEIDTESDDAASMSHEDRQRRESEVLSDLLDIERQEAALVWLAQSQNLPCEFRHDTNPLAILQCKLVTVPRVTNGLSSSEHAYDIVQPDGGRR